MIQIVVLVSDLSYSSIAKKAIKHYAGSVMGKAGKWALKLVPKDVKRKLAIEAIKHFEYDILNYINKSLDKKSLPITVSSLDVYKANAPGMELEFCFGLGTIDYAAVFLSLYENKNRLIKSEGVNSVLSLIEQKGGIMKIGDVIDSVPQNMKDMAIIILFSLFGGNLTYAINSYAQRKDWKIELASINARSV